MPYRPLGIFRTLQAFLVFLQHIGHVGPSDITLGKYAAGSITALEFSTPSETIINKAADRFYRGRSWSILTNCVIRILPQYLVAIAVSSGAIAIVCLSAPSLLSSRLVPHACSDILASLNISQNILMFPGVGKYGAPLNPYVRAMSDEFLFYLFLAVSLFVVIHEREFTCQMFTSLTRTIFALSLIRAAGCSFQYTSYFLLGVVSCLTVSEQAIGAPWLLASVFASCLWACITHSIPDFILEYRVTSHEGVFGIVLCCILSCISLIIIGYNNISRRIKISSAPGKLLFQLYPQQYAALIFVAAATPRSYNAVIAAGMLACLSASFAALGVERPIRSFRDRVRGSRMHLAAYRPDAGQVRSEAAQIGTVQLLTGGLLPSKPSRVRRML